MMTALSLLIVNVSLLNNAGLLLFSDVSEGPSAETETVMVFHAQGELSGEVTATSVLLQSRLTAVPGPDLNQDGDIPGTAGVACFEYSDNQSMAGSRRTAWMNAAAETDFIVRTRLKDLRPGSIYYYRLVFGRQTDHTKFGPIRQFRTLPSVDRAERITFCMGSCMNYYSFMSGVANGGGPVTATAEDRQLGFPAFASMLTLSPDFFIGTGDIVYYDHPSATAAKSLVEMRRKWHEQFRFPRLVSFFARTPAYWSKDDHDFRYNDADLTGQKLPEVTTGIDVFREQLPLCDAGDRSTPSYRTHRVHRDLQLWFTEGRDFRSQNRMPDGPEKSLWGKQQREWLQQTLMDSDARWKIIITPTPMVGPDSARKRDNHTNLDGFRYEADSFFAWLREHQISGVMSFCGDRHWQYHSIHPSGFEEFSVGALNDENSIRGTRPGDRNGTDPDGLIRQPFIYPEPTGGFLYVQVEPTPAGEPKLVIQFRDDHGKMQYRVERN